MKQIFPKEIIQHSTEYFIAKNTVRSSLIYSIILVSIITVIFALPFIETPIFTTARGYIKPEKERISLTSITSGKVIFTNLRPNLKVFKGDTLLVIKAGLLDDELDLNQKKLSLLEDEIKDLENILEDSNRSIDDLSTPKYQQQILDYNARKVEHLTKLKKLKVDYDRNEKLFSKGVIAKIDFENSQLEYNLSLNALSQFRQKMRNNWQMELTESKKMLLDLTGKEEQLLSNKKDYIITAPMNGTILKSVGLDVGSFINPGVQLAEITPDTELIVECYLSPKDIGLIDKSKPVNFQIDAFNYNQWGLASGTISEVAEDIEFMEGQPFYKVRCQLNESYLQLKNGYKRNIGKGMTLNARFEITERTLYQLLYDKFDDWLNPGNGEQIALNQ